ncbi:DUF1996 domain-containing protein [Dactylosporangium vinaceum]|nr:DUF1996 domain-containing protein [Dactylosporangium vinaceum]
MAGAAALAVVLGIVIARVVPSANAGTGEGPPSGAVRAVEYAAQHGARTENTTDAGGGRNVGWLADGDWLRYDGVDLGAAGPLTTSVRMAAAYPDRTGAVELHLDAADGPLLAAVPATATGGWQAWVTRADTRPAPGGRHAVFVVPRSPQGGDFVNLNWFSFSTPGTGTATVAPPSSPPAAPSTPAPTSASPATGWIPVDAAAWAAQLAAFRALPAKPRPAGANHNPEFNATCTYSHSAPDDPIVLPGLPGASHLHSFVGNDSTNASTTPADLTRLTASSCKPLEDHSAYWVPTLLENGKPVEPQQFVVYYGSLLKDPSQTVPMPQGLRMIAGDAKKQVATPKGAVNQFYCAGGPQDGRTRSADGNWPVCEGGTLHFTLRFPDCWDGRHLDSPNHRDHVSFGQGGACPATHPVPIPALTFSIAYPASGTDAGFALSSGLASSMHGDAFFAWDGEAMAARVKNCVVQVAQCNTAGQF